MIGYLAIVYVLIGTAVATETLMRMRDHWLKEHLAFNIDREDLAVVVVAGALWPLTLVAGAWLWLYVWRKGRVRGSQGEG